MRGNRGESKATEDETDEKSAVEDVARIRTNQRLLEHCSAFRLAHHTCR